jgi:tripartite ATP-independent transporter DctM subunit
MDLATALPFIMFAALLVMLMAGFPVAYTLGGTAIVFAMIAYFHPGIDFHINDFGFVPSRIFGIVQNFTLIAVPLFIFMGMMLEKSNLARELLESMELVFNRVTGGLAVSVVVVGALLAASTGIVGATVVTMGVLSLPTMLARGYDKGLATGTIAASGTLGQIIPPSIVLVLLGDIMNVDVGNLFTGAIFPGIMLVLLYMVYLGVRIRLQPSLGPRARDAAENVPEGRSAAEYVARSLLPPALLILLVLGSILGGIASPTEAAACGASGAIILTAVKRRLTLKVLKDAMRETAFTTAMVFTIFIGAQVFGVVFRGLRGDFVIESFVANMQVDPRFVLFGIMALMFVLGFFLDFIEICFIVIPIMMPLLYGLELGGMGPEAKSLWLAIMIAINLQTSFLTPPFGFALFYLKGVAPKEVTTADIYRGIVPFVGIQLIVLAIVYFVPEIVLWLPRRIFGAAGFGESG